MTEPLVPATGLPLWTRLHLAMTTALALAAVTVLVLWVHERSELVDLAGRSIPATATVLSTDDFEGSLRVRVAGRVADVYLDDVTGYSPGDEVGVQVDPAGRHGPYAAEDPDPDDWELLALPFGALLLLGVIMGTTHPRRIVDLRRRVRRGEAVGVVVGDRGDSSCTVAPVDDPFLSVSRLTHLHVLESVSVLVEEDEPDPEDDELDALAPGLLIGGGSFGAPALVRVDLPFGPLWLATVWPTRSARSLTEIASSLWTRTAGRPDSGHSDTGHSDPGHSDPGHSDPGHSARAQRSTPRNGPRSWLVGHRTAFGPPLILSPVVAGLVAYGLFGGDLDGWSGSWAWLVGGAVTCLAGVGQLHHVTSPLTWRSGDSLVVSDEFVELVVPLSALRGVDRRIDRVVLDTDDGEIDLTAFWPDTLAAQTELDALATWLTRLVATGSEPPPESSSEAGRIRPARGLLLGASCAVVWTTVALVASGARLPLFGS